MTLFDCVKIHYKSVILDDLAILISNPITRCRPRTDFGLWGEF